MIHKKLNYKFLIALIVIFLFQINPSIAKENLTLDYNDTKVFLEGDFIQGGLVKGKTNKNISVKFKERLLRKTSKGFFVIGFGRDHPKVANLSIKILTLSVAFIVLVYIFLKLIVSSWKLIYKKATKLVFIMGATGGVLQGTAGLSAPISITFLNAMKLERNQFIPTISVYFGVMSIFQMPTLYYYDFLNFEIIIASLVSTIVLLSFMPIGSWIAKSVSKEKFDKITLILLAFIAVRIIYLNF